MSKYIVEIKPEYEDSFKGLMILGAKDSNLFVDALAVEDIEELNSDYINEHFGSLQDDAYQKGFEDGKAQSEDGCEGCQYVSRTSEDKPCVDCSKNFDNHWTAKQTDEIKVGDEVISNFTKTKGILLEPETEDVLATIIVPSQRWRTIHDSHDNLEKTGRHFDIDKILEEMRE